jgi:uncharacterized caspase-like protein
MNENATSSDDRPNDGRLIAVVVGINNYRASCVADLTCAANDAESVFHAVAATQSEEEAELTVLMDPPRIDGAQAPTRDNILRALRRAAETSTPRDTVLVFFAGHGGLLDGRTCLFPTDVRLDVDDPASLAESVLTIEEIQRVFSGSACRNRVMFLDCCQNSLEGGVGPHDAPEGPGLRSLTWRAGAPASQDFVASFQQSVAGWSLVLSCSPNEMSLEDPAWGDHGIFSHFLSVGLRGAADLDRDGVVSLPELVQYLGKYVPQQATAVIAEMAEEDSAGRSTEAAGVEQVSQNPALICGGPVAIPLTHAIAESRGGFDVGVLGYWLRYLRGPLPFQLHVEPMLRYGTALIYGAIQLLGVLLLAAALGRQSDPWSLVVATLGSAFFWIGGIAFSAAAIQKRWHAGGYLPTIAMLAWHIALVFLLSRWLGAGGDEQRVVSATVRYTFDQLALVSVMFVFGFNAYQCILSLAELEQRGKRVALRKAFSQLEERWINADIPNLSPMVSGHPRLYLLVALGCFLLAVTHSGYQLLTRPMDLPLGLIVLRDFLMLTLILWLAAWYAAAYRLMRARHLPDE